MRFVKIREDSRFIFFMGSKKPISLGFILRTTSWLLRQPSSSGFRSVVKIEYIQETPINKYYAGDLTKDGAANSCNEAQVFDVGGTQNKLFFKKHRVRPIWWLRNGSGRKKEGTGFIYGSLPGSALF